MPRRSAMHAQPQRTLKRLVKQYGRDLIYDTRRTEALLRDLCGQHRREIFVLINAQKQRVPAELLTAPGWLPYQAVHSRLSRQLQQRLAMTEDAADWAVNAWATALDVAPTTPASLWGKLTNALPAGRSSSGKARRQDAQTGVQSGVQSESASKRRPARRRAANRRTRAQRAELGWQLPALGVTLPPLPSLRRRLSGRTGWIVGGSFVAALLFIAATVILLTPLGDWPTQAASEARNGADSAAVAAPTVSSAPAQDEADAAIIPLPALEPNALLVESYPTPRYAQVSADGLLIRQGPSTGFDWVSVLSLREAVRVVGYSDDGLWSQIDQPRRGWVSNDYLTFQSPDEGVSVQLRVRQVRTRNYETVIRTAPRADAQEVATLVPNQPIRVVAVSANSPNNWLQVVGPASGWLAVQDAMWPAAP